MGFIGSIRNFITYHLPQRLQRRFRFPALAEANKALFCLEQMVTDPKQISQQLEMYKDAQDYSEKERDRAYIPIYFSLEEFVISHQPPVVQESLTKEQVRERVRQAVNLDQMSEHFRLIFLPANQQADHLLKIGAMEFLNFLVVSLGQSQLSTLIKTVVGTTPLSQIVVNDDGISFTDVHPKFQAMTKTEVVEAYKSFYTGLYEEIKNLFGENAAHDLVKKAYAKINGTYEDELVSLFINTLPEEAQP